MQNDHHDTRGANPKTIKIIVKIIMGRFFDPSRSQERATLRRLICSTPQNVPNKNIKLSQYERVLCVANIRARILKPNDSTKNRIHSLCVTKDGNRHTHTHRLSKQTCRVLFFYSSFFFFLCSCASQKFSQ